MKIALSQINPTIGDFKTNTEKMMGSIEKAKGLSCDLIIFSETHRAKRGNSTPLPAVMRNPFSRRLLWAPKIMSESAALPKSWWD